MTIEFTQICRDYLALRGESPDLLPLLEEGEESAVLTLRQELETKLAMLAEQATLACSRFRLDELRKAPAAIKPDPAGYGVIRLPGDYLKLYSLRLGDWNEPIATPEPDGTLRRQLGANAPSWMICRCRPMVVEDRDTEGPFLKVYGSEDFSLPADLIYVPKPVFDGRRLTVASAIYPAMLRA